MQHLQRFQEMERGLGSGEYFLSDYADDTQWDAALEELYGGDMDPYSLLGR